LRHRLCRGGGGGRGGRGHGNAAQRRRTRLCHRPRPCPRPRIGPSGRDLLTAPHTPARLVILLSGRGSNFEAIKRAIEHGRLAAEIVLVISDKPDARGLRLAREAGLPWAVLEAHGFASRDAYDEALALRIQAA